MSYDIEFGIKAIDGNVYGVDTATLDNPTYNLGKLFRECTGWDFKQGEWYPAEEAYPMVCQGVEELEWHPGEYRDLLPDNGWGTLQGAHDALRSLMFDVQVITGEIHGYEHPYAMREFPPEMRCPLEVLYVRW